MITCLSAAPKLAEKFLRPPFAEKSCGVCHAAAKDGKVAPTQRDAKSLCVTCHGEQPKEIETAKLEHPGAAGDCSDCHSAHASQAPVLINFDLSVVIASGWKSSVD
jgi:predicted CXXCH cytochrome family protein